MDVICSNYELILNHQLLVQNSGTKIQLKSYEKTSNRKNVENPQLTEHAESKSFKCDLCAKMFSRDDLLVEHRRTHISEKSLNSDIPSKDLPRNSHFEQQSCDQFFKKIPGQNTHLGIFNCSETNPNQFKCNQCQKVFTRGRHLDVHVREMHTGQRIFHCEFCEKKYTQLTHLREHLKIHHRDEWFIAKISKKAKTMKAYEKVSCDKILSTLTKKKIQPTSEKNQKQLNTSIEKFRRIYRENFGKCLAENTRNCKSLCQLESFKTKDNIIYYDKISYTNQLVNFKVNKIPFLKAFEFEDISFITKTITPNNKLRSYCDLSIKKFGDFSVENLKLKPLPRELNHQQLKDGENKPDSLKTCLSKNITCIHCPKTFSHKGLLTEHMRSHTGDKFKCLQCVKTFIRKDYLTDHLRVHNGERPFICETCGKTFIRKGQLHKHLRMNHGVKEISKLSYRDFSDKNFNCKICNLNFSTKASLQEHLRSHPKDKRFKCSLCDKSFVRKCNFNDHLRTHDSERSFLCGYCEKSFKVRCNAIEHVKLQHGEKAIDKYKIIEKKSRKQVNNVSEIFDIGKSIDASLKSTVSLKEVDKNKDKSNLTALNRQKLMKEYNNLNNITNHYVELSSENKNPISNDSGELEISEVDLTAENGDSIPTQIRFESSKINSFKSKLNDVELVNLEACTHEKTIDNKSTIKKSISVQNSNRKTFKNSTDADVHHRSEIKSIPEDQSIQSIPEGVENVKLSSECSSKQNSQNISLQQQSVFTKQSQDFIKERPFICEFCEKTFLRKGQLNKHLRLKHHEKITLLKGNRVRLKDDFKKGFCQVDSAFNSSEIQSKLITKVKVCDKTIIKSVLNDGIVKNDQNSINNNDSFSSFTSKNSSIKNSTKRQSIRNISKIIKAPPTYNALNRRNVKCRSTKIIKKRENKFMKIKSIQNCSENVKSIVSVIATKLDTQTNADNPPGNERNYSEENLDYGENKSRNYIKTNDKQINNHKMCEEENNPKSTALKKVDCSNNPKNYKCNFCNRSYKNKCHVYAHMRKKHANFWLEFRKTTFKKLSVLKCNSSNSVQNSEIVSVSGQLKNDEKHYSCELCPRKYSRETLLTEHVKIIHQGERSFKCKDCDKTFARRSSLEMHTRIHSGERPFNCEFCGKTYRQRSHLNDHLRSHRRKKFQENIKGKTDNCSTDKETVNEAGDFEIISCGLCSTTFSRKTYLKVHMRIHSGEKPFKCEQCFKKFRQRNHLKEHLRIHDDIRPYKCTVCDRPYRKKHLLIKHMIVHTGEKPFSCAKCNSRFTHDSQLKKHEQRHLTSTRFTCDVCGSVFKQKSRFDLHTALHLHDAEVDLTHPFFSKRKRNQNKELERSELVLQ